MTRGAQDRRVDERDHFSPYYVSTGCNLSIYIYIVMKLVSVVSGNECLGSTNGSCMPSPSYLTQCNCGTTGVREIPIYIN